MSVLLTFVVLVKAIEDEHKQVTEHLENFVVVFHNLNKHSELGNFSTRDSHLISHLHFEIQSHEFTHVPMSVGVFCAEHWPDFKHFVEVSTYRCHLLVELRRLGQTSII